MSQTTEFVPPEVTPQGLLDPDAVTAMQAILAPPTKLLNRNFVLLWQGQVVSALGSQFYGVAMLLWIKQATASGSLLGLINMISGLAAVFLGVFSGVVADRYSRRGIVIVSDLVRGLLMLALAALFYLMPTSTNLIVLWLFGTTIGMAAVGAFFNPAIEAAIPDLVPEGQLARANSLNSSANQIIRFLGQALGGLLFRLLGAPLLTLLNGVTFLFSAVSELFIAIPQKLPERRGGWRTEVAAFRQDLALGFRYVGDDSGLKVLIGASAFLNLFTTPVLVLLPFYIEDFLKVPIDWYGYFLAVFSVGVLVGSIGAGAVRLHGQGRAYGLIGLMLLNSVLIGLFGFTYHIYIVMALACIVGASIGFNSVYMKSILQARIPRSMRGRVFGLMATVGGSTGPLGMGLGGLLFDWSGQNIPLIYGGCGVIQLLASIVIALHPEFRRLLAYPKKVQNENEG